MEPGCILHIISEDRSLSLVPTTGGRPAPAFFLFSLSRYNVLMVQALLNRLENSKSFRRLSRYWLTVAFIGGFLLDNITLNRVDQVFDNVILATYVVLSMVALLLMYAGSAQKLPEEYNEKARLYAPLFVQFAFGGLLSGMLIFYGRSGDFSQSWPFILLILFVIYANETLRDRSARLVFNLAIFFIGLFVVMAQMLRPFRMPHKPKKVNSKPVPKSKTKFEPYLKSIALLIGLAAFVSKIVDYQFKMMAADAFPNQNDLVSFFGTYYMSTGAATLIMQFFVTGFILTRFGILAGLLVLPISLVIGSSGFLAIGTLSAVFIAKFSDQVFKFSTNNAVREILWLPVAPEKKRRVKPIIDGTIRSGLEGLAGVLIFALVSFKLVPQDNIQLLSLLVILGVLFWLWNSWL